MKTIVPSIKYFIFLFAVLAAIFRESDLTAQDQSPLYESSEIQFLKIKGIKAQGSHWNWLRQRILSIPSIDSAEPSGVDCEFNWDWVKKKFVLGRLKSLKDKSNYYEPPVLPDHCKLDTLYSWQKETSVLRIVNSISSNGAFERPLFAAKSAIGSYGYGTIATRLKLKPNVRFKIWYEPELDDKAHSLCQIFLKEDEKNDTIVVRVAKDRSNGSTKLWTEYLICSWDVVESWSYGQKEHHEEILKELSRVPMKENDRIYHVPKPANDYLLWLGLVLPPRSRSGVSVTPVHYLLFPNFNLNYLGPDGVPFYSATMITRLEIQEWMSKNGRARLWIPGEVQPVLSESSPEVISHFSTQHPVYFNKN